MWFHKPVKGEKITDEAEIRKILIRRRFKYQKGRLPLPFQIKDAIEIIFREDQSFTMRIDPTTKGFEQIIMLPAFRRFQEAMEDVQKTTTWRIEGGLVKVQDKKKISEYTVALGEDGKYLVYNKDTVLENK